MSCMLNHPFWFDMTVREHISQKWQVLLKPAGRLKHLYIMCCLAADGYMFQIFIVIPKLVCCWAQQVNIGSSSVLLLSGALEICLGAYPFMHSMDKNFYWEMQNPYQWSRAKNYAQLARPWRNRRCLAVSRSEINQCKAIYTTQSSRTGFFFMAFCTSEPQDSWIFLTLLIMTTDLRRFLQFQDVTKQKDDVCMQNIHTHRCLPWTKHWVWESVTSVYKG